MGVAGALTTRDFYCDSTAISDIQLSTCRPQFFRFGLRSGSAVVVVVVVVDSGEFKINKYKHIFLTYTFIINVIKPILAAHNLVF